MDAVGGNNGQPRVGRLGPDSLVKEDVANGVGIRVGMYQTGNRIRGGIGAVTLIAQTPAEFVAVALLNDAALACLPLSALVDVPVVNAGIFASGLVLNPQVANDALAHIAQADIAFGTLAVDVHQTGLRNLCIAITV